MMETCYVVAERFSRPPTFCMGLSQWPRVSFLVFLFAPSGVTAPSMREMLDSYHGLKAETAVITDAANREIPPKRPPFDRPRKKLDELYTPIPYIIPAQLFSACLAAQKGLDPDKPRTLTKVITLTM